MSLLVVLSSMTMLALSSTSELRLVRPMLTSLSSTVAPSAKRLFTFISMRIFLLPFWSFSVFTGASPISTRTPSSIISFVIIVTAALVISSALATSTLEIGPDSLITLRICILFLLFRSSLLIPLFSIQQQLHFFLINCFT